MLIYIAMQIFDELANSLPLFKKKITDNQAYLLYFQEYKIELHTDALKTVILALQYKFL